ncbi:MAG: hypothetical protein HFJ04_01955 [Lachnospiraceae bacterium]|nr:hypothetical protein [Lachnospiraceae bacterium]
MSDVNIIRGYKVFNPDWTCLGKQYTCPGIFEEDVAPHVCGHGMHFCRRAEDCFKYYDFDSKNHVAEVVAHGEVAEDGNKCCTDKLEVVREIIWEEVLKIVNSGKECTGINNSGNRNSGNRNSGNGNSGNGNSGDRNSGNGNSGDRNSGRWNSGDWNSGDWNSGDWNSGNGNSGSWNSGRWNSGDGNSGNGNSGNGNSGRWNSGDWNSGDWNKSSYSNGCFNTKGQKIYLFNEPSEWTFKDWAASGARYILDRMPGNSEEWISTEKMTVEEKAAHPEHEITGGYLKTDSGPADVQGWWDGLEKLEKETVCALPNFDKEIFLEITGIDVDAGRR